MQEVTARRESLSADGDAIERSDSNRARTSGRSACCERYRCRVEREGHGISQEGQDGAHEAPVRGDGAIRGDLLAEEGSDVGQHAQSCQVETRDADTAAERACGDGQGHGGGEKRSFCQIAAVHTWRPNGALWSGKSDATLFSWRSWRARGLRADLIDNHNDPQDDGRQSQQDGQELKEFDAVRLLFAMTSIWLVFGRHFSLLVVFFCSREERVFFFLQKTQRPASSLFFF